MKRNEFLFGYTGQAIAEATAAKAAYHQGRLDHWRERSVVAAEALRGAGVDIREFPVTNGIEMRATVNPVLHQEYDKTQGKVRFHTGKVEEYERWNRGFTNNPDWPFELDPDDIAYFGL